MINPLIKKIAVILAIVVFILFIALVTAAWFLGAFASVTISTEQRGPYFIITSQERRAYPKLGSEIEVIKSSISEKNTTYLYSATLLFSDPMEASIDSLEGQAACIVSDSVQIDPPFICMHLKKRLLLVASISANPTIAMFKTYPALKYWQERNGYEWDNREPILESYAQNGMVTVELPIRKKSKNLDTHRD